MGIATNVELHKLYEAAIAFRKLQPWKWMYASQVFIVHDDERDIDGFCSIMGMMGEHFSLSVYLGESGYQSYRYLYDKASLAYMDHIFMKAEVKKNCLTVSFEDPESLTEHDDEQAMFLGYQFKGKNECPRFRYHHPGIYSWYLTDGWQCRFLTKALEQAMIVARLELTQDLQVPEIYDNKYYLRGYTEEEGWTGTFVDANLYRKAPKLKKTIFQNDLLAYRLKKLPKLLITLEAIQFYLPNPVVEVESGQPFFMLVTALVDSEEGQLFYLDIQETAALYLSDTVSELAKQFIDLQIRPCEIVAEDEDAYALLEDFCKQIDVKLSIGHHTACAHEFAEYIYDKNLKINIPNFNAHNFNYKTYEDLVAYTCSNNLTYPIVNQSPELEKIMDNLKKIMDNVTGIAPINYKYDKENRNQYLYRMNGLAARFTGNNKYMKTYDPRYNRYNDYINIDDNYIYRNF